MQGVTSGNGDYRSAGWTKERFDKPQGLYVSVGEGGGVVLTPFFPSHDPIKTKTNYFLYLL